MGQQVNKRKKEKKPNKRRASFFILKIIGLFFILGIFFCLIVFIYFAKDLPRPEKFSERQFAQSTKIFDRTGEVLLYELYGEEKRTIVSIDKIPDHLKQAVVATEDAGFYNHFGIDAKGLLRSVLINLGIKASGFTTSVGGSTIDQQLIRSTFLTAEKTAERKIREIILSLEIDRRYSKDKILEWYLNQVPFGVNIYGVEAASQTYFKKPISEISIPEAAMLAALIQAPSRLSPYGENKEALLARKNYVLERMAIEGYINEEELENIKQTEIEIKNLESIKSPHFVLYLIENFLKPKYGQNLESLRENGVKIYTTLDWDMQQEAEKIVKEGVKNNETLNAFNASLVSIDPKTGQITVMVGSADWFGDPKPEGCVSGKDCLFDPKFNIAVGTESSVGRQPGSSFKPIVYVTAFKKGYNASTTVIDEKTSFGIWGGKEYLPQNYDGLFRGTTTLRNALAQSLNVPAVKVLLDLAGIDDSVKTAKELGISTLKPPYGPSIVLGGWEVKLLDITSAYGVFAAEGLKVAPSPILRIEDYSGNILEENKNTPKRIISSNAVRILNDILSDNKARSPMFGSASNLYFPGYQVAAKTGTTQNYRDAWTIGYSPSVVVGVWVGNNNNESMKEKPSVTLAGPIFHSFMQKALLNFPKESFTPPKPEN